jgi:hypothetical protein
MFGALLRRWRASRALEQLRSTKALLTAQIEFISRKCRDLRRTLTTQLKSTHATQKTRPCTQTPTTVTTLARNPVRSGQAATPRSNTPRQLYVCRDQYQHIQALEGILDSLQRQCYLLERAEIAIQATRVVAITASTVAACRLDTSVAQITIARLAADQSSQMITSMFGGTECVTTRQPTEVMPDVPTLEPLPDVPQHLPVVMRRENRTPAARLSSTRV